TNLNYSQNLLSTNPNRIKYLCNNQSVFVREDSKFMKIFPGHETLSNRKYCIFTCLGGHFFKLKLDYNNDENCILYEWIDFGTDYKFENPIISKSLPDSLSSLREYLQTNPVIEYKGTLSMLFILEYNRIKLINREKRKAIELSNKLNNPKSIHQGIAIYKDGWKNINPIAVQGLGLQLKTAENNLKNVQKRLRRSHNTIMTLKQKMANQTDSSESESEYEDESENKLLDNSNSTSQEIINKLIKRGKLGSTIMISTEVYLSLLINQQCSKCKKIGISMYSYKIRTTGLSVKITLKCRTCNTGIVHSNESLKVDFSKAIAGAGLVDGVNREELRTILALCGIIRQSGQSQYFKKQEEFPNRLCVLCGFYFKNDLLSQIPNELYHSNLSEALLDKSSSIKTNPLDTILPERELINMNIPTAVLYASSLQPPNIQSQIFGELSAKMIKILLIMGEKYIENIKLRSMLQNLSISYKIQFVIDEAHCIVGFEKFRNAWNQLGRLKSDFPNVLVLLLTATCSQIIAQKIMTSLNRFDFNIIRNSTSIIGKYHGSLDDITKNVNLDGWKNGSVEEQSKFKQMFYHNKLKSSYESLNSITYEEQVIDSSIERQQQYLAEGTHKILEIVTKCENDYHCRQQLIYNNYHWPNDSSIPECQKCNNCKCRHSQESTLKYINRDIVVDVFITAKNKVFSSKGLSTLDEYGKKTKKQNVILKPIHSGLTTLVLVYEIIRISSNAINLATSKEWKILSKPNKK
ncbi:2636_t:CDS:10, partial [Gigaspora rosea]